MANNAAQKRKALGATKRRQPLPWRAVFKTITIVGFSSAGIVAAILAGRFLAGLPWQEWQFTVLPIENIVVEQVLVFQQVEALDNVIDSYKGLSLIAVDVNQIRSEIVALPWIAEAVVRKAWPDQITISLEEHQPIARWNNRFVLNSEGQPLQQPAANLLLAELQGPDGQEDKVMEHYLQFMSAIKQADTDLVSVTLFPRGAWQLETREGITISLGDQQVLERSRRVVSVLSAHNSRLETIESIDARYANGAAVQYRTQNIN